MLNETVPAVPPIILSNIGMVTFDEGDTVVLDCISMGIPQPVVTWFRNSVQLPNPGLAHIQQDQNDSLIFSGVRKSDEGDYVCWAKNAAGNESATVSLRVNGGYDLYCLQHSCSRAVYIAKGKIFFTRVHVQCVYLSRDNVLY